MDTRSSHRLLAIVLGAFLALGMTISAIQAGEMTVNMALASDMGTSESGGCTGCGGDEGVAAGDCHPVCMVAGAAVLPWEPVHLVFLSDLPLPSLSLASAGQAPSPDPSPPKINGNG